MIVKSFIYCVGLAFISGAVGTLYWLEMYRGAIGDRAEPKVVLISMLSGAANEFISQNKTPSHLPAVWISWTNDYVVQTVLDQHAFSLGKDSRYRR